MKGVWQVGHYVLDYFVFLKNISKTAWGNGVLFSSQEIDRKISMKDDRKNNGNNRRVVGLSSPRKHHYITTNLIYEYKKATLIAIGAAIVRACEERRKKPFLLGN